MKKKSKKKSYYFELQATWGLTKHTGGLQATKELIKACHIGKDSYVLDVGCGVGITACYLAKEYGCKVVGVDISKKMVERAKQRAKKQGVSHKVKFRVGDAQKLPFKDRVFDAVICESVVAFPKNKQKVVSEYARVTKSGGYVGMNELTWIKTPPPEMVEYLSHALEQAKFLSPDGWKGLMKNAGLRNIRSTIHRTSALRQWANELRHMDPRDYLGAWGKLIPMLFKDPALRKWLRKIALPPLSIFRIFKYWGYGLYVGKKT
jgi:ubiquinone/menaquinone biosynthesis C-methylase UbiE